MPYMTPIDGYRQAEQFKQDQQSNSLLNMLRYQQAQKGQQEMETQAALRTAAQGSFDQQSGQIDFDKLAQAHLQAGDVEGAMKARQMGQTVKAQQIVREQLSGQTQAAPVAQVNQSAQAQIQPVQAQVQAPNSARTSTYQKYLNVAEELSKKGMGDAAQTYYSLADKFKPELKEQKVLMQNGQRIVVNYFKDGTSEIQPFNPDQEKLHFADTGGQIAGLDPFTGKPVSSGLRKTLTPGEMATDARARQGLEQGKWSYDAERGLAINAVTGEARPINIGGTPLGKKNKPLTAEQQKIIDSSNAGMSTIDRAIKLSSENPKVFNQSRGLAENLPLIGGPSLVSLVGKYDSRDEQAARGAVFQEAATVAHELLGSAQSPSEKASVQPFLPSASDNQQQVVVKLEGLKRILQIKRDAITSQFVPSTNGADTHWNDQYQSKAAAVSDALNAIRQGAPRDAVRKRLLEIGITDAKL